MLYCFGIGSWCSLFVLLLYGAARALTISGWMVAFLFRLALHTILSQDGRCHDVFGLSGRPLSCTLTVSGMDGDFLILVCGSRK